MLKVHNVSFSYKATPVLRNIEFTLEKGMNLALIGESGCGKSTLLKLIYGLLDTDHGKLYWGDKEILGPKFHLIPGMPYMKYLAQDFDLMPFITVAENVGRFLSNFFPEEKKERIATLLEVVEMTEFSNVKAQFLSGGQMQRVALARVLALEPEVLLLDEPFSHIDNFRKNSLRRKLFKYLKSQQITTIIATHDSTDVFSFSDEVIVMREGQIIERNSPERLYGEQTDKYIASLFGDVNQITINNTTELFYPHQIKLSPESHVKALVIHSYFKGSHYSIEAQINNQIIYFENQEALQPNSEYGVIFVK